MDLSKLETLQEKLLDADDFYEVFNYFFDHFGENTEFLTLGEQVERPLIEQVLAQVGQHLLGASVVTIEDLLLVHVPEHNFIHGGCIINGRMGNLFYFEDIQQGLLAVLMSFGSGETQIARFTAHRVKQRPDVHLN